MLLLLTLDIIFDGEVRYDHVRNSGVISKQLISRLYKVSEEEVQIFEYDPAFAIKITIPRRYPVGDEQDSDIYGAQGRRSFSRGQETAARLWEPGASPVAARVRVLVEAKTAGLKTAVMFGPPLPGVSDSQEAPKELFGFAARVGVDHIWTDALNPRPLVWPSVQAFLKRQKPDLLALYRTVLFDRAYRRRYLAELNAGIRDAAASTGLADRLA